MKRAPLLRALALASYLAVGLAIDTQLELGYDGQYALAAVTWLVLAAACASLAWEQRAQVIGVVVFATIGEVTGSLIWGVYTYRLHNLPLFIPPGHGIVYLTGLSLAAAFRPRPLVLVASVGAIAWAIAGLTVLPRLDVAGAFGVPLLCAFLWWSRNRAAYAGVFVVVAALELYGTAIGTWRWAERLPGLGISQGNPPSGAASGYVWFDVMAMLIAPTLLLAAKRLRRVEPLPSEA